VSRLRFEPGTSQIWRRSANHMATMFGYKMRFEILIAEDESSVCSSETSVPSNAHGVTTQKTIPCTMNLLTTINLHISAYSLKCCQLVKKLPAFMEPTDSLLCLQMPETGPYPDQ
jgi:hypothetical protein